MDEELKKTPVKTNTELLKELRGNIESRANRGEKASSVLEAFSIFATEYTAVNSANEARKSPEQLALDAQQASLRNKAFALERVKKAQIKSEALIRNWIKRDTWLVYDEALPLTKAEVPDEATLFNPRDSELWALTQSCAGHSLQLINLDANPKQWRVKPFEWVRWLKEKEQYIHLQLIELIYPKTTIQPTSQTAKATQSREITKRDRQKAIKAFALTADELARKNGIEWNSEAIPVTKTDFIQVFGAIYTAHKKVTLDTFDRDIAEIGLKFKRGTKSNKNNVLKQLFSIA
jgi:anion-transporting  ArsA/GET3 family ATPase